MEIDIGVRAVGWTESAGGVGELTESPSESEKFGFSVGRLTIGSAWQKDCPTLQDLREHLEKVVASSAFDDIILRTPSALASTVNRSDFGNRRTYAAGTLLYWDIQTGATWPNLAPPPATLSISSFAEQDDREASVAEAMLVITSIFQGYQNHYASNSALPETSAADAYQEWAASRFRAAPELCFVGRVDSAMAGIVVTADLAPEIDAGEILLAGVHSDFRNQGIYTALLASAVGAARARGRKIVYASTQAHNVASQRAWVVLGGKPCHSIDTFHLQKDSHRAP